MNTTTGYTPLQAEAISDDQNFSAFARSRTPAQWAWVIRSTFECEIMQAWVASVIWWRFQVLKTPPCLAPLDELMENYPNEDNPYPLVDIEAAFAKLGGKARVDRHVKRRDVARMERQRNFPDAPARGPATRTEPHGKRHYKVTY